MPKAILQDIKKENDHILLVFNEVDTDNKFTINYTGKLNMNDLIRLKGYIIQYEKNREISHEIKDSIKKAKDRIKSRFKRKSAKSKNDITDEGR